MGGFKGIHISKFTRIKKYNRWNLYEFGCCDFNSIHIYLYHNCQLETSLIQILLMSLKKKKEILIKYNRVVSETWELIFFFKPKYLLKNKRFEMEIDKYQKSGSKSSRCNKHSPSTYQCICEQEAGLGEDIKT